MAGTMVPLPVQANVGCETLCLVEKLCILLAAKVLWSLLEV